MKEYKDVMVEGSDFKLSLVKIAGKAIKDITGYVSTEFDTPTFKLCNVVFEDGSEMGCEGEHDMPYLVNYKDAVITEEQLQNILDTDPERKDD
jgi:hypothetical protein